MGFEIIKGVKTFVIKNYDDYIFFLHEIEKNPTSEEEKNIKLIFDKDFKLASISEENHFVAVFNGYVQNRIETAGFNIQIEVQLKNDAQTSTINRSEMISEEMGEFIYSVRLLNVDVECVYETESGERVFIDGKFFAIRDGKFCENFKNIEDRNNYEYFLTKIKPNIQSVKCTTLQEILNVFDKLDEYDKRFKLEIDLNESEYDDKFFNAISRLIQKAKANNINIEIVVDAKGMDINVDTVKGLSALKEELGYAGVDIVYAGEEGDTYSDKEVLSAMAKSKEFINRVKNSNASPFEKFLMIYRFVSSRPYVLNDETPGRTRDIISVLNGEDIVCAGYANLLKWLCDEVGIKCEYQTVKCVDKNGDVVWHANNRVYIEDEKYGINGWYHSDPTFDSPGKLIGEQSDKHYAYCLVPISDVKYMKDMDYCFSNQENKSGMFYKNPADLSAAYGDDYSDFAFYIGEKNARRLDQPSEKKLDENIARDMVYEAYDVIERIMKTNSIDPSVFDIDNYNLPGSSLAKPRLFGGMSKYILLYLSGTFSEEELEEILIKAANSEVGKNLKKQAELKCEGAIKSEIEFYDRITEGVKSNAQETIDEIEEEIARLEAENAPEEEIAKLRLEIEAMKKNCEEKVAKRIAERDAKIEEKKADILWGRRFSKKENLFRNMKDFMVEKYYNWVEINEEMEQERQRSKVIPLNNFFEAIVASYVAEGFSKAEARRLAAIEVEETGYIAEYVYDSKARHCFMPNGESSGLDSKRSEKASG